MYPYRSFVVPAVLGLTILTLTSTVVVSAAEVSLVEQTPVGVTHPSPNVYLVDFGRVAFGNLKLLPPADTKGSVTIRFGEKLLNGRVDTRPPGSVRYSEVTVEINGGQPQIVAPPADARNTEQVSSKHPPAALTPAEWGVVLPFRWVEIEGWPAEPTADQIVRRAAFATHWDDEAASFESSDPLLNQIWELCRYTIKATTFAGVYVDGDRERISYEADSYLNQLGHYYSSNDIQMARDTHERLMKHETWPTECAPHMVFMAHADWMHTGDLEWLAAHYEALKAKTLAHRVGENGLVTSRPEQLTNPKKADLVDWPPGERDAYVFSEVNTVVNAFHVAAMTKMAELARALGKLQEAADFEARAQQAHAEVQKQLFISERGIYRDGIGTDHTAQHATLFPLAFDLVPEDRRAEAVEWLSARGMKCSVYAAQYLLEGLFKYGGDEQAIELILAPTDRSWRHMIESGTTMTWEAWDQKYKTNQDWNHPWGTAPANLLPRFVLGVQALEPGWQHAVIRPHLGGLTSAKGKVPTPHGPINVQWENESLFKISIALPAGVEAKLELPASENSSSVMVNGKQVKAQRFGSRWILDEDLAGTAEIEVR